MLIDSFKREIDYLRISVTKQCNFRCMYCMPDTPLDFHENDLVSLEDMLEFVKIAIDNGVKKIRITGGEPLLRQDLCAFVHSIHIYKPSTEIALTTNGSMLDRYAMELKKAGLHRINISLDTLKRDRFAKLAQKDMLDKVLEGIDIALQSGLGVKLNAVALKGINDDEILDLIEFAFNKNVMIRFIEFMENSHAYGNLKSLNIGEILSIIGQKYTFSEIAKSNFGPAKIYSINELKLPNGKNLCFGVIAPHNDDFCQSCNRLRITAEGVLCPCLYFQESVDLKDALDSKDKDKILDGLKLAVKNKPEKNQWSVGNLSDRAFYKTGG